MSLVFNQVGMTNANTLMRYKPEEESLGRAVEWTTLYLLKESRLNTFLRLVLTPAESPDKADLIWTRTGTSKRFIKYDAVGNENMPALWGWNDKKINGLYIPKGHPINELAPNDGNKLYLTANYGGPVEPKPESVLTEAKAYAHDYSDTSVKPQRKSNEELSIRAVLLEGLKAARDAANTKEQELEKQGPKFAVKDAFTGEVHGTLHDVCGGAWISGVDGRSQLGRIWKKLSKNSQAGFYLGDNRHAAINVTKSQYQSVRKAAAEAFVKLVNARLGTDLSVWTYID